MTNRSHGSAVLPSALGFRVAAPDGASTAAPFGQRHPVLALIARALLVGLACFLGTETVALNLAPVFVSPVWPTNSILLCALVATPVRHWWAYAIAAFFSSVYHNAHTPGAPLANIPIFLSADFIEVVTAAIAVRVFAAGLGAFESLRNLVAYLIVVILAPFISSFVAANAAPAAKHWILWRSWFLTDTSGYLTLAPALLTWISFPRTTIWTTSRARRIEAGVLAAGLLLTTARVFMWPARGEATTPALMYLPLPFLLWAAARFGPRGATASIAIVTLAAMSGALRGHGPFSSGTSADNALALQLFLMTTSPPLMFLAVLVEEEQWSQKALRRSEARYRAIVEDQTELICRFLPDGTYTFVNDALCREVHRAADDLVGRRFWDLLPPGERRAVTDYLSSITPDGPVAWRENRVSAPGRDERWHHWTTRGFFDDRGAVTEYQAVGRDITERKRAEEEHQQLESQRQVERVLRASEERFRSLADNAPVLIWMSGLRNEAVYFNKPWLDFTGRSLEEELGLGWIESIHPDDRERCVETCDAAFARREPLAMQFRLRRRDGEYRWILDNGIPHFAADGAFNGYVGSCVDITSRKLAEEELEQAGRRKDEFLAMLGHELRNPLAPIGMAVEIMRRRPPTDGSVVWARDIIARQLRQLTRLVDDLLDISRINRGKVRLLLTPLDLTSVVAHAVETSRPLVESAGHELTTRVPSHPVWVRGDSVRLGQVLANLLNNAAKYTPAGGHIRLSVAQSDSQVILTVADDGVGLSAEMVEHVFDLFWQVESRDDTAGGLGIGLTLVKRLVELHGGDIEARSPGRGRGSEFIVRLPALEAEATQPAGASPGATPEAVIRRRRILVVDDNVDAAQTLAGILQLHDQDVSVAHDGDEALQVAGAIQPDVVFLDLDLPKIDGLEVARRLRSGSPVRPLLLVATTGFGQEEIRRRTAEAGFDHHLVKPIDPDVLRSLLAAC